MASYVSIAAIDAVVGGTEVTMPATYVALKDHATGYEGEGSYHIQLVTGGALGPVYRVTYSGFPNGSNEPRIPNDDANHMTVHRVVLDYAGNQTFADKRKLNVGWMGVNATVAQMVFTDGSYLETGVVTERTCAAGLLGGNGGLLDGIGSAEGDLVVRGAIEWQALAPGSSGYVLTSNGTGAIPTWQAGGGSSGVTSLNTETGAITLTSPDSSVSIGGSGTNITLETSRTGLVYDAVILATSGLYAYYEMNETSGTTMVDSKGTNNGIYSGGTQTGVPLGISDGSRGAFFDGASGYAYAAAGVSAGTAQTFEFIARVPQNITQGSGVPQIAYAGLADSVTQHKGMGFGQQYGGLINGWGPGWGNGSSTSSTTLGLDDFYSQKTLHFALTYDGTTMNVYVNGVQLYSSAETIVLTSAVVAGGIWTGSLVGFNCRTTVGKIALYSVVLSQSTIIDHALAAGV